VSKNVSQVNIRQANEIGRVHAAPFPQMKETYCGRPVNEEEWLITSKEANCTACARAGASRIVRFIERSARDRVYHDKRREENQTAWFL
jgi:hypothetical protein